MSQRRLLVLDAYDADRLRACVSEGGGWDVLLLGLSEDWFRCFTPDLPPAGEPLRFVDQASLADDAHTQVREFMLKTVGGLPALQIGGRTLADILTRDLRASWWHMETSEKGPYRTPLVSQLYQLAILGQAVAVGSYAEVVVAARQPWLRRALVAPHASGPARRLIGAVRNPEAPPSAALKYWRRALSTVMGITMIRLAALFGRWPRLVPGAGVPAIFSFYPAWWTDAMGGASSERFFSALPPSASVLAWFHAPGRIWRERRAIAAVVRTRRLVVLQRFVGWRRLLGTLSIARFARTMRLMRELRSIPSMPFADVDVAPLIADDLDRSFTSGDRFESPLLEQAASDACRALGPSSVVYRAECQPSERALVAGLRGVSKTVGFHHYPFGRRYLPYWDRRQPMPDAMISCGAVGRDHLVESGYPAARIALCGPQRHAALLARLNTVRDRPALRRRFGVDDQTPLLLVAPAIVEADTEALFGALIAAIDGFGPCRIAVRTHPNRPDGDAALVRAIERLGAARAQRLSSDVPLYDAIEASDALITIGSTLAFEAMALACMPIAFENPSTYAATSLAEFSDALYIARGGDELGRALRETMGRAPEAERRRGRWRDAVDRMLGDLSTPLDRQLADALEAI